MKHKIQALQEELWFHCRSLATDLGLIKNHRDYCRFIILGQPRIGSNFLLGLLNSHSQVISYGELYRCFDYIGWDILDYNNRFQTEKLVSLMQKNPRRFLETEIFKQDYTSISAIGFKIFYGHGRGDSREIVWNYLKSQKDIKVIHLKRKNLLKVLTSFKKAEITNEWQIKVEQEKNEKPKNIKVSLDYKECLGYFNWIKDTIDKHDMLFSKHQILEIFYEDLEKNKEHEMKLIEQFLGLEEEMLKPDTIKQSSESLSESISNYFELKEKFQNTPWENFFED